MEEKMNLMLSLPSTHKRNSDLSMYKVWVRSHADLPIKIYQIVNTFRYETKHTRPLIRLREITSFKEAHTVHATWEEAAKQVEEATGYTRSSSGGWRSPLSSQNGLTGINSGR